MVDTSIYKDIATRTGGDIYIGVVGPVRTGKSTFIKRFMDTLVLPNIETDYMRERAMDELPQSSSGRTIMTTEPKFIPENGVQISLESNSSLNVRMIDCVGYTVPSALGYSEDEMPRMVMTPWSEEAMPFDEAAEIGTRKVITEHSTIGLVITTDGSISDIPRDEYELAEERVINELKDINKPFIVLYNCMYPDTDTSREDAKYLSEKYEVPVIPVNCLDLDEQQIRRILAAILFEFPIKEIKICMPSWVNNLSSEHWLKSSLLSAIKGSVQNVEKIRDAYEIEHAICGCESLQTANVENIDHGSGSAVIRGILKDGMFFKILSEETGLELTDERDLLSTIKELTDIKTEFSKVKNALNEVEATGYGIVMPDISELKLEEPEIVKQGGRYGVKLRASAPSIHMMRADITTEVSPIVGSEKQSEDLIMYLLDEFNDDPVKIWDSNIFGKSLHELVNEGLHTKLARMPSDARLRLQETIERVINEGCNGLICIIL